MKRFLTVVTMTVALSFNALACTNTPISTNTNIDTGLYKEFLETDYNRDYNIYDDVVANYYNITGNTLHLTGVYSEYSNPLDLKDTNANIEVINFNVSPNENGYYKYFLGDLSKFPNLKVIKGTFGECKWFFDMNTRTFIMRGNCLETLDLEAYPWYDIKDLIYNFDIELKTMPNKDFLQVNRSNDFGKIHIDIANTKEDYEYLYVPVF